MTAHLEPLLAGEGTHKPTLTPRSLASWSAHRQGAAAWPSWANTWLAVAASVWLASCSHLNLPQSGKPGDTGTATAANGPSGASTPSASPGSAGGSTPSSAPAFDTVVKGADRSDGLLPVWKKQEKVWIELAPGDFGRAFFLSPKLSSGVGEAGVLGGLLASRWAQVGKPQWVEFRRVNQQVQLVAINAAFKATPDTPAAQAVQAAFSNSMLASVAVASAPHPQRGTVLVEASSLLTGDLLGMGAQLQRAFRQSYALDGRNTTITQTRSSPASLVVQVQQHFATGTIASPSGGAGPQPTVPSALPDPRSLFLTVQYTLTPLPTQAMVPRMADARVGYFTTTVADFTDDLPRSPRQRFINRWQLEKKDPAASMSPPVRPLVYWLDGSIPKEYRATITEGILAWNKAFEAIGIQGAIEVRDDPAKQPLDIVGNGQAIIRWITNHQPSFGAIGPTHVDPRTGEILTADIALESLSARAVRTARSQIFDNAGALDKLDPAFGLPAQLQIDSGAHTDRCEHAELAAEQLALGLDVLAAGGTLPPDSEKVKAFVLAYLKDTTMHEVGHTLGLRHNFRASRWRTQAQLQQLDLTTREGNSASVMDYAPINIGLPGQPWGAPFQTTLGPYDFWAIEYGYKAFAGDAKAQQAALRHVADRQADPAWQVALDYGTDEDQFLGLDPQALTFDLGRDVVEFGRHRLALARDLIARQGSTTLGPQDEPALLRRRVNYALRDIARTSSILLRQVGGVVTRRDAPGSGRALLDPLPAAQQRAALTLLTEGVLSPRAVRLPPALLRQLAPDYMERGEGLTDAGSGSVQTDFSAADQLTRLQREVLLYLMNDALADRLLDNIDKTRDREPQPLTVRELHRRLREAIWLPGHSGIDKSPRKAKASAAADKASADEIASWQRNLQRDHVSLVAAGVLRAGSRADVRSQWREQARWLIAQLQKHPAGERGSTAEAHRQDCLETLRRALAASVLRSAP